LRMTILPELPAGFALSCAMARNLSKQNVAAGREFALFREMGYSRPLVYKFLSR
jgi:hypothetical protein